MITAFLINFKVYEHWGHLLYFLCIGLLIAVLLFGKYVGGSKRWLVMGPVSIQPSEMVKLAVIIMLAKYYARMVRTEGLHLRELVTPVIITRRPLCPYRPATRFGDCHGSGPHRSIHDALR